MMDSFPLGDDVGQEVFFTRSIYMLMLVGTYPSPLGARREVKAVDLEQLGTWEPCSKAAPMGFHLLEGAYENFDGTWPDAVLPAWYHSDYKEWECDDGHFSEPLRWMLMPWLPDVWQAAIAYRDVEAARIRAQIAATKNL